jgi:hypothetical protein
MKVPKIFRSLLWNLAVSQAPLLVEGTSRLLTLIRGRIALAQGREVKEPHEMTVAEMGAEIAALRRRAQAIDDAQLEQIKLIQQVVEQNRTMAQALRHFAARFRLVLTLALLALVGNLVLLGWVVAHHR